MKLNMKEGCVRVSLSVCVCMCVPVGPVCLRGLVLAGGWQGRSVWVRMRECVWVCVGRRVGGARGALWGGVVGVGSWGAAVVQTVELIHLLICGFWTKTERDKTVERKCHTSSLWEAPKSPCHVWKTPLRVLFPCALSSGGSWLIALCTLWRI